MNYHFIIQERKKRDEYNIRLEGLINRLTFIAYHVESESKKEIIDIKKVLESQVKTLAKELNKFDTPNASDTLEKLKNIKDKLEKELKNNINESCVEKFDKIIKEFSLELKIIAKALKELEIFKTFNAINVLKDFSKELIKIESKTSCDLRKAYLIDKLKLQIEILDNLKLLNIFSILDYQKTRIETIQLKHIKFEVKNSKDKIQSTHIESEVKNSEHMELEIDKFQPTHIESEIKSSEKDKYFDKFKKDFNNFVNDLRGFLEETYIGKQIDRELIDQ
ncbi:18431_t:CDS:1 [Racocetra fulgida]|uniref:18431_t:CDS:1 n=1 Tax=Racocetra fulgida TaxID=60492 RepID=A0A9N9BW48_9GLOM|nr:18431_t:CDS:1 [Racocetra fulgida]